MHRRVRDQTQRLHFPAAVLHQTQKLEQTRHACCWTTVQSYVWEEIHMVNLGMDSLRTLIPPLGVTSTRKFNSRPLRVRRMWLGHVQSAYKMRCIVGDHLAAAEASHHPRNILHLFIIISCLRGRHSGDYRSKTQMDRLSICQTTISQETSQKTSRSLQVEPSQEHLNTRQTTKIGP